MRSINAADIEFFLNVRAAGGGFALEAIENFFNLNNDLADFDWMSKRYFYEQLSEIVSIEPNLRNRAKKLLERISTINSLQISQLLANKSGGDYSPLGYYASVGIKPLLPQATPIGHSYDDNSDMDIVGASSTSTQPTCPQWQSAKNTTYFANYQQTTWEFTKSTVHGVDNYGLRASELNRKDLFAMLKAKKADPTFREKFKREMQQRYENVFNTKLQKSSINTCKNDDDEIVQLYAIISELRNEIGGLEKILRDNNVQLKMCDINISDIHQFGDSPAKFRWSELQNKLQTAVAQLDSLLCSEFTFENYILFNEANPNCVSRVALIEYARTKGMNLCVWKRGDAMNRLHMDYANGNVSAADTIHLYCKDDHFERLNMQQSTPITYSNNNNLKRPWGF